MGVLSESSRASFWRWAPVLAWMGLIWYWSSQSDLPIDQSFVAQLLRGNQHRLAHLAAYAILGILVWRALPARPTASWSAWLVAAAYGAIDEVHQSFTPGRRAAVDDWLVDAFAAAVAIIVARWLVRRYPRLEAALQPVAVVVVAAVILASGLTEAPSAIAVAHRVLGA